jgi:membrane-associated phospholipid phosphatase
VLAPVLAGVLSLSAASTASADPGFADGSVVYTHSRADLWVMGASALAITVPTLLAPEIIDERCPCSRSSVNRFDRWAIGNHDDVSDYVSSATVGLAMIGPPLADWLLLGRGDALYADLTVFAEVLLVNGALVEIAKYSVQRPLPRTYAGDPTLVSEPGGYRSFYSGHASTAFAALGATAFTLRQRYGERVWPWIAAAAVGTSVGIERVAAGRHFPSDVIVGAVVGTAVGVGVPALHVARHDVAVLPARGGVGVALRF